VAPRSAAQRHRGEDASVVEEEGYLETRRQETKVTEDRGDEGDEGDD